VHILALHGLGFIAVPTLVAKETMARFGFRTIGHTEECRQQFYAITAERRRTHPAILAIISRASSARSG